MAKLAVSLVTHMVSMNWSPLIQVIQSYLSPSHYLNQCWHIPHWNLGSQFQLKLEQLEHVHSENTPRRPMIIHTIDLYQIPCHKKPRSRLQTPKICQNFNLGILQQPLHMAHRLKLLDKMHKYEMDLPTIVEDTEQTRLCPQTDGQMEGRRETSIPPFQLRWSVGYN